MAEESSDGPNVDRLVTVVIPTYNRADLIGATIESVLNQQYSSLELLVVDDGSIDDTKDVVLDYAAKDMRIKYIARQESRVKGANTCRNIGWENAHGEYIKWLDSDDMLQPDCIRKQVNDARLRHVQVCFCKTAFFEEKNNEIVRLDKFWSRRNVAKRLPHDLIYNRVRWATLSGLWKRDTFEKGPFKEGLTNSQEWLFHIEASLSETFSVSYLDEVLCMVRVHAGSMSNKTNKKGKYYYNQAYAIWLAIEAIRKVRPAGYKRMIAYLLRKLGWFHAFTFYKGGYGSFLRLFQYYPRVILYLWR